MGKVPVTVRRSSDALPPRERVRAFRKQLILEAAETVFAAHGFEGASVEEIASGADVAIATLYKVFGNKEALFAALIEYRQDEFLLDVESFVREGATPAEQLERFVTALFRYFERHQQTFRVYLSGTHGLLWGLRSAFGERTFAKYLEFVACLAQLLAEGMRAGAWPRDDADWLAVAAIGTINGLLTRRYATEMRGDVDEEIRHAWRLVARMVQVAPVPSRGKGRGR